MASNRTNDAQPTSQNREPENAAGQDRLLPSADGSELLAEFDQLTRERVAVIVRHREFHDCDLDGCDTDKRSADEVEREGYSAGLLGVTDDQCPYGHAHPDRRFNAWQRGRWKARGEWCDKVGEPRAWHRHSDVEPCLWDPEHTGASL